MGALARLAEAIGYPDRVPEDAVTFAFAVDDAEIRATERGGRILLERTIWTSAGADPATAATVPGELADYAAGRILREEAVIAWDPKTDSAILWQDAPTSLPADRLRLFFELFTASCDWWRERTEDAAETAPIFPEMMILP